MKSSIFSTGYTAQYGCFHFTSISLLEQIKLDLLSILLPTFEQYRQSKFSEIALLYSARNSEWEIGSIVPLRATCLVLFLYLDLSHSLHTRSTNLGHRFHSKVFAHIDHALVQLESAEIQHNAYCKFFGDNPVNYGRDTRWREWEAERVRDES